MTRHAAGGIARCAGALLVGLLAVGAPAAAQQLSGDAAASPPGARGLAASPACERCHADLELLRQQVHSLARAQRLLTPAAVVAGSAHADLSCAECHTGFGSFPHASGRTRTETCGACHEKADSAWSGSVHAEGSEPVACAGCHGVHDLRAADTLREQTDLANAGCVGCHELAALPVGDPHADSVACTSCHAAHETVPIGSDASPLLGLGQAETCGGCHEDEALEWRADVHGLWRSEARVGGPEPGGGPDIVACTDCHGGHGMQVTGTTDWTAAAVERCADCHADAARTFFDSYHGKATALGSRVVATCADCHGGHGILPASDPASRVAEPNLVRTCGECHERARPAFVQYDSHPDPLNRARNPAIFYSFVFMNSLLLFVLLVFGLHTLLWWVRLELDKRRGRGAHGSGA